MARRGARGCADAAPTKLARVLTQSDLLDSSLDSRCERYGRSLRSAYVDFDLNFSHNVGTSDRTFKTSSAEIDRPHTGPKRPLMPWYGFAFGSVPFKTARFDLLTAVLFFARALPVKPVAPSEEQKR